MRPPTALPPLHRSPPPVRSLPTLTPPCSVPITAPPCLNHGLNGLRRLRGLPHIPTATLPFPAAIRRRDRPLCLSLKEKPEFTVNPGFSFFASRDRPLCLSAHPSIKSVGFSFRVFRSCQPDEPKLSTNMRKSSKSISASPLRSHRGSYRS